MPRFYGPVHVTIDGPIPSCCKARSMKLENIGASTFQEYGSSGVDACELQFRSKVDQRRGFRRLQKGFGTAEQIACNSPSLMAHTARTQPRGLVQKAPGPREEGSGAVQRVQTPGHHVGFERQEL